LIATSTQEQEKKKLFGEILRASSPMTVTAIEGETKFNSPQTHIEKYFL
jgi:hypothetical protein